MRTLIYLLGSKTFCSFTQGGNELVREPDMILLLCCALTLQGKIVVPWDAGLGGLGVSECSVGRKLSFHVRVYLDGKRRRNTHGFKRCSIFRFWSTGLQPPPLCLEKLGVMVSPSNFEQFQLKFGE